LLSRRFPFSSIFLFSLLVPGERVMEKLGKPSSSPIKVGGAVRAEAFSSPFPLCLLLCFLVKKRTEGSPSFCFGLEAADEFNASFYPFAFPAYDFFLSVLRFCCSFLPAFLYAFANRKLYNLVFFFPSCLLWIIEILGSFPFFRLWFWHRRKTPFFSCFFW